MVLHDGRRVLAVAFAAALFCAPPANAGILDTIKGLFGGGAAKAAAGDDKTITTLMEQVEASQKDLAAKQTEVSSTYNGSISNIKPGDTALQGKLDALQSSSNSNSALYLRLLQARADVAKGGDEKALAAVNTRLAQITTTQQSLESNYQKIQDTNRQAGFFTPTASGPAASEIAGVSTGNQGGDVWNDPTAQKAIDEWLTAVHMNPWGQWTGARGSTTVRSAGAPDSGAGRGRHETVYRMLASDNGHSNMTLSQYVEARLAGSHPEIFYDEPAGNTIDTAASDIAPVRVEPVQPPAPTPVAAAAAAAVTPAASQIATPSDADADISVVDNQLKGNYDKLMSLQKEGAGTSDGAKALLKDIEALQAKRTALVKSLGR